MRDFPTITSRGREGEQDPLRVLGDDAPKKNRFYALRERGPKHNEYDDDGNPFISLFSVMSSF